MSDKMPNLSDAIRMGAALTKPWFGGLCTRDAYGDVTNTCALGAGLYAINGQKMTSVSHPQAELENRYPWLQGVMIKYKSHGKTIWYSWFKWIWASNDRKRMTREQIADELKQMGL